MSRYNKIAILLASLLWSCGAKPGIEYTPKQNIVSIAYLKSLYKGYPVTLEGDITIEGVLRSNDREGNFYKTMVIEDQTGGIDIKIDLKDYFIYYKHSHKYTIRCGGLTLGSYGGTHQLGYPSPNPKYQVTAIPEERIALHVGKMSQEEYPPNPTMMNFKDLSAKHISCWVGFDPVQFVDEELGLAWTQDDIDTHRHLIDNDGDTLDIRTGIDVDYAYHLLPSGSGSIEGILGYFNQQYSLRISTLYYVVLESPRFVPRQTKNHLMNSLFAEPPTADPLALEYDTH